MVSAFDGFTRGTKLLPVPSPLLGSLLADIDDVAELKCTLRMLWYTAQVAGAPKWVDEAVLVADDVLNRALGSPDTIRAGLRAAFPEWGWALFCGWSGAAPSAVRADAFRAARGSVRQRAARAEGHDDGGGYGFALFCSGPVGATWADA